MIEGDPFNRLHLLLHSQIFFENNFSTQFNVIVKQDV